MNIFLSGVIVLVMVGLIVWAIKNLIPLTPPFSKAIDVISTVFVVLYVGSAIIALLGYGHFPILVHFRFSAP